MKLTIQEYSAVALWKWVLPDGADDTCGICRVEFEGACSKCKYPGEDCPLSIGECSHAFHQHCITNWLNSEASQGRCPMCRQVFREKVANATPANAHANAVAAAAAANAVATNAARTPQTPRTPATGTTSARR